VRAEERKMKKRKDGWMDGWMEGRNEERKKEVEKGMSLPVNQKRSMTV
jgi:hypothetical protein